MQRGNIYVVAIEPLPADSVYGYPRRDSNTGLRRRRDRDASDRRTGGTLTATTASTPTATATPTGDPDAVSSPTTLSAAPAKISFGSVDASGTSKPKKVTLTNKGTNAAVIGSVIATAPFAIAGVEDTCSGQSIAAKKKCSFEVEFSPATPGAVSGGSIEVSYNGTSPAVSLSGTGIAVTLKAPSKETFSPVAAGGTGKPKAIKISNPATVSVSLGTTSIGGTDPKRVHDNGQQLHGHAGGQTRQLHDHDGVHAEERRDRRAVGDGGFQLYIRREHRCRVDPDLGYCQVDRSRR